MDEQAGSAINEDALEEEPVAEEGDALNLNTAQDVTLADFESGGELTPVPATEYGKGKVIYVRQPSAEDAMTYAEMPTDTEEQKAQQRAASFRLLADSMFTKTGERLVPAGKEQLVGKMPSGLFMRVLQVAVAEMKIEVDAKGNVIAKPAGN